jgi:hypothetical protein
LLALTRAVSYLGRDMNMILNNMRWVVYRPVSHEILMRIPLTDTVTVAEGLINDIEMNYVLYMNGYMMGEAFGKKLVPHWKDVDRVFYKSPGRDLRKAGSLIREDKWYFAGKVWDELSQSHNKKLASRAAFNIALAYEKDDDLEQALSWISYSDSLNSTPLSGGYKLSIQERIKQRPVLNLQMGGN